MKMRINKMRHWYYAIVLFFGIVFNTAGVSGKSVLPTDSVDVTIGDFEQGPLLNIPQISSISSYTEVSGNKLAKTPTANVSNTFIGLMPGATVFQASGEPGQDGSKMYIRSLGSYNYGGYTIYVDGYQTEFSYLQYMAPSEIQSVAILKDAASLATFGMKGAAGVLWVTTKRGIKGKPKLILNLQAGLQQPILLHKPLPADQYASLYNEAYSNDNRQLMYYYGKGEINYNTDWYSEVLRSSSPLTRGDLSVRGGINDVKYFVLLGYLRNDGLYNVKNDEKHSNAFFRQYNIRANLDFRLFNIFEGKVNINGRIEEKRAPNYSSEKLWNNLAKYPNIIYSPKNVDGTFAGTAVFPDNPYASINELGYVKTDDRTLMANFDLREKLDFIVKGLYLTQGVSFNNWTRGTYSISKNYARFINGYRQTPDQNTNYTISDDHGTNQWSRFQLRADAGYDFNSGQHSVNAVISYLQNVFHVDANMNGAANVNNTYAFQNISGRIHYDWASTYMAELGFAYSGSDNFAKNNRFRFYPTISLGWNVFSEVQKRTFYFINNLKLRASVGTSGYDYYSGGRYLYQKYFSSFGGSFATGNDNPTWQEGLGLKYIPNPKISAEKSMKVNLGIDSRLFNHLTVVLDAFIDKRSNIITQDHSTMAVFGAPSPYKNLGKVTVLGFEAVIDYTSTIGKLKYSLGGSVSYAKNKIDYMAETPPLAPDLAQTGRPIGTRFGYEAIGFYDINDFNPDGSLKAGLPVPNFGKIQPGDVKYKDRNNDNIINEYDQMPIGKSFLPVTNYTTYVNFEYAGFELHILAYGMQGRSVNLLDARNKVIAFEHNGNVYEIAKNRWAYYPNENVDTRNTATYPRLSLESNNNNYQTSTLWMKSGDFFRIRNIELGYNLPDNLIRTMGISNMRVFLNVVNPFTFSKLTSRYGLDPEVLTGYPVMKSVNVGLNINF